MDNIANLTNTSMVDPGFNIDLSPITGINQTTTTVYLNLNDTKWAYLNNTTARENETDWAYLNNMTAHQNETEWAYFNNTTANLNKTEWSYFNKTSSTWNSTSEVETASTHLTWVTYTLFGLTCCFVVLGLCGNGLILVHVSMLKFRRRSHGHSVLITTLAICDSVALISAALPQPCVHDVFGMDIRALSTIVCKLSWVILFPSMFGSSATVVLICMERFAFVRFPLQSKKLVSPSNILKAVCICMSLIVVVYATMAVLYCEIKDGVCHPNFEGSEYSTVLKRVPNTSVYIAAMGFITVTSMLILCICTPLTIVKLYKQMAMRRQLTAKEQSTRHFDTSVKLIAVVIAHITLLGLPVIIAIAFGFFGIVPGGNTISALALAILLNHSINFLLYNIFDTEFRGNMLALFGIKVKDRKEEMPLDNTPACDQAKTNE